MIPKQLQNLADELEQFPLGNCGPSDDPDKQTAYLYAFKEIAKRFVAAARRARDPQINAELANIYLDPDSITDAYDLRAALLPAIDLIGDRITAATDVQQNPIEVEDSESTITAFISYSSRDKAIASQVKELLEKYGIRAFLAHDDIHVSEEWKVRILTELKSCHVFIPLLSEHFRASDWAEQEIGAIAVRQNVLVIPLCLDGVMPFGFISHIQGRKVPNTGPNFNLVIKPLVTTFPRVMLPILIKDVKQARSFRTAEVALEPLVGWFPKLTDEELLSLVNASIDNGQVWDAQLCRDDFLPKLLATEGARIPAARRKILEFQIKNHTRHPDS